VFDHDLPLIHELNRCSTDGLDVRLLWNEYDGRVSVTVNDATTGDAFRVRVLAQDRAVDVFENPFAYAALRGVDASGVDVRPTMAWPRAG
jgi:hypothetical protein